MIPQVGAPHPVVTGGRLAAVEVEKQKGINHESQFVLVHRLRRNFHSRCRCLDVVCYSGSTGEVGIGGGSGVCSRLDGSPGRSVARERNKTKAGND